MSALTLQHSSRRILIQDLHIGLDIEDTYFNLGFHYHPHAMNIADRRIQQLAARYQQFRDFVHVQANITTSLPTAALFVRRESSRVVLNMHELVSVAREMDVTYTEVDLEYVKFTDQLQLLFSANVIVATAGTALHNMLFMRPGTSAIILMQPEWCDWAWQYANQAVLLDIHATVICSEEVKNKYFSWARTFWRQGPRMTKLANFTVDIHLFRTAFAPIATQNDTLRFKKVDYMTPTIEKADAATAAPPIRIVLTSATASPIQSDTGHLWEVKFAGELVASSKRDAILYESMKYLTVCVKILRTTNAPLCCQVDSLMYFGYYVARTDTPVIWLHYWAQVSPDGMKIRNSDGYSVVDIREPVPVQTRSSVAFSRRLLLVDATANIIVNFTDHADERHSFSNAISRLYRDHDLTTELCIEYVPTLTNYAQKLSLIQDNSLPGIHFALDNSFPFVLFLVDPAVDVLYKE